MIRIAIIGDPHGNLPAVEAVLRRLEDESPDAIYHAGDVINGPVSRRTLELLDSRGIPGVFGNHEEYILQCDGDDTPERLRSERFNPARCTRRELTDEQLREIASWPILLRPDPDITLVHGTGRIGHRIADETSNDVLREAQREYGTPVIVAGHTHRVFKRVFEGTLFVNAGSVGRPVDGDPRAPYAVLERKNGEWDVRFERVEYDRDLLPELARGWIECGGGFAAVTVHEMQLGRRMLTPFLRRWDELWPGAAMDDAYQRFAAMEGLRPLMQPQSA